jgi:hypothetical protein
MKYHCALTLMGVVDHDGVRDIIRHCQAAGFGLAFNPVEHMLKGHNTVHTDQPSPLIDALLLGRIKALGLSAEWSAHLDSAKPEHHNPVTIYHAPSKTEIHGWTDELDTNSNIQTMDTSKAAASVLQSWPDPRAILNKQGFAQFHVISSSHEAIKIARNATGDLREAIDTYMAARSDRGTNTGSM